MKEEDIIKEFEFAGKIEQVRMPKRSDGATKGFAYVEFEGDECVEKALTKHNDAIFG